MRVFRRLLNPGSVDDLVGLCREQNDVIRRLRRENIDLMLAHTRISRDLIAQFLIALDHPESHDDLQDVLHRTLVTYNDEVARLEEHTR